MYTSIFGEFIRVGDDIRNLVERCELLFYLNRGDLKTSILDQIGKVKFTKYTIQTNNSDSESCVFPSKIIFDNYVESLRLLENYEKAIHDDDNELAWTYLDIARTS